MRTVTVSVRGEGHAQPPPRTSAGGEDIAIGRRGKAEVRLVAIERGREERPLGAVEVPDYWMSDDFDEPLVDLEDDFDRS